jgi:hypothetical protein
VLEKDYAQSQRDNKEKEEAMKDIKILRKRLARTHDAWKRLDIKRHKALTSKKPILK